jgi:hypothetical protein
MIPWQGLDGLLKALLVDRLIFYWGIQPNPTYTVVSKTKKYTSEHTKTRK